MERNVKTTSTKFKHVLPIEAHSLADLNWQAIANELILRCKTEGGQQEWATNPFLADTPSVATHLQQVDALMQIRQRDGEPITDLAVLPDDTMRYQRAHKGSTLSANELGTLTEHLRIQRHLFSWFKQGSQHIGKPACLTQLIEDIAFPLMVYEPLQQVFTADGKVHDTASETLLTLRQQLISIKSRITEQLQQVMQRHAKHLQDQIITERDGRAVLAVQVGFKNQVKGIILDTSASGATVFIEPQSVVPLNNERRLTEKAIDDEIFKLCQQYSALIGEHADTLCAFYQNLVQLDRRYAGALLALALDAQIQNCATGNTFSLIQMRHPLLLLRNQSAEHPIIGNNLFLGDTSTPSIQHLPPSQLQNSSLEKGPKALVITGPNTGGKTVLLKTIGLCAWMHRAGLPLPTQHSAHNSESQSHMGFFQPILSDIGDHQDLSQDLSSFSGHLHRIRPWLKNDTRLTSALVLMDEVGTGTDPQEGSALAQAIMLHLIDHGATLAMTTHLENLKNLALLDTRFINARVAFDLKNLKPTYQLVLGTPGTSHALHIAQQLGIPSALIRQAETYLSQRDRQTANLLGTLEAQHHNQSQTEAQFAQWEAELSQRQARLEQLEYKLNERKDQFQQTTQAQVRERVYEMDRYIKRLKRQLAQQERDAELSEGALDRAEKGFDKRTGKVIDALKRDQSPPVSEADLHLGLIVQSKQLQCQGTITHIDGKKRIAVIDNNGIPMRLPFADLRLLHIPVAKKAKPRKTRANTFVPARKTEKASPKAKDEFGLPTATLKLLGLRIDDAMAELEQFMDDALRQGHQTIAVIHGHGTGALKKAIRTYLREHQGRLIKRFGPAPQESGGDGQTLIQLL